MRHQREESAGVFNLLKKIWIFYSQLTKKVEARRLSMKSFNSKKVPMVGFFGNTESLSLHKSNICLSKLYHHKSQKTISICLRREFGRGLPQSTSTCRMNILQLWRLLPLQNFNQLITLSAKFCKSGNLNNDLRSTMESEGSHCGMFHNRIGKLDLNPCNFLCSLGEISCRFTHKSELELIQLPHKSHASADNVLSIFPKRIFFVLTGFWGHLFEVDGMKAVKLKENQEYS